MSTDNYHAAKLKIVQKENDSNSGDGDYDVSVCENVNVAMEHNEENSSAR